MGKRNIKIAVLSVVLLFTGGIFIACNDDEGKEENKLTSKVLKYTQCLTMPATGVENIAEGGCYIDDSVDYSLNGHDLLINCYNLAYNCCDSVLKLAVAISNDTLFINELGDHLCDCICHRDAQFKISNIPSGHYVVSIFGRIETFEINVR